VRIPRFWAVVEGPGLLSVHGPAPSILDEQIIRRHDERTGVHTSLPLA
jgi:hypothetical protein